MTSYSQILRRSALLGIVASLLLAAMPQPAQPLALGVAQGWFDVDGIAVDQLRADGEHPSGAVESMALQGDEHWADGFGGPGMNEDVHALALHGSGTVYAGGCFTFVGGVSANHIAKWDGSNWSALGSGMGGGSYTTVLGLAVDGSGNLYVGGDFTTAGGVSANYIAKWDGSQWSALGSGMNGSVRALAVDSSGYVYAGGGFTAAGGVSANRIAKWDGSTWSGLGSGMNSPVEGLAFDGSGNLYAGGYFSSAGGATANRVAKWDGTRWSALGSGMNSYVKALAFDGSGTLYAGGNFTKAGGITVNYVAKWDGSSWSALGSGMSSRVNALALDDSGNLYAGGEFTTAGGVTVNRVAKWDGSSWSALGSGLGYGSNTVFGLAVDGSGNLCAGGYFWSAGGVSASHIATWDGRNWSALVRDAANGLNGMVDALAVDGSGNPYAGGRFSTAGGVSASHIAKWDGSNWSRLGTGMNGYYVTALAIGAGAEVYAGGDFTTAGGLSATGIAKWDGSNWSALGSGMGGSYRYVHALAVDGSGNLYAGGWFTAAGGVSANYVAKWDGSSWSALGSGMNRGVRALAVDGSGNLYAGGWFTAAGGVSANYIAKWDGSNWSRLGTGMSNDVRALAIGAGGEVYAGGDFTTAGGVSANYIAKWDGGNWSPLTGAFGNGMDSWVSALAVDSSGNLYAGGSFTTAGGASANGIARWDGSSWSALGSGMNDDVYALALDGNGNLYAGGDFTEAGGKPSSYIALWLRDPPAACHTLSLASPVGGTVSGVPDYNCPTGYKAGTKFSLMALSDSDHTFLQWSGDVTGGAYSRLQNLVIDSDKHVEAHFAAVDQKPAVVFVHGFSGTRSSDPARTGCASADLARCISYSSYPCDIWESLGKGIKQEYDVYAARIDTEHGGTPSLQYNADCLRRQLDRLRDERANPYSTIVLVAHSMGGLVARAYLEDPLRDPLRSVSGLITIGTPHVGTTSGNWCGEAKDDGSGKWEVAACQFSFEGIKQFNGEYSSRRSGVNYALIGGDYVGGRTFMFSVLARRFYKSLGWSLGTDYSKVGPNDAAVGAASATGREYSGGEIIGVRSLSGGNATIARHVFSALHVSVDGFPDYFDAGRETYDCIKGMLVGDGWEPTAFGADWLPEELAVHADVGSAVAQSADVPIATIASLTGEVEPGGTVTHRVTLDAADVSTVVATCVTGTLSLTLTSASGTLIDPDYAAAHPEDLIYMDGGAALGAGVFAGYQFTNTVPGHYTATLHAAPDNQSTVEYELVALAATQRVLEVATDRSLYPIGSTAALVVTLTDSSIGVPGAAVVVDIGRSGVVSDTLLLQDLGDGTYTGDYLVPDAPGYLTLRVSAEAEVAGEPFTRVAESMLTVMSPAVSLRGTFADTPVDEDEDGRYDHLEVTIGVTCTRAGGYTLSANLVDLEGGFVAHALASRTLAVGAVTATLAFNGDQIRASAVDGPYVLTNLTVTDHEAMMVPAIRQEQALWQTAAYSAKAFSRSCYLLEVEVEEGEGGIAADPAADCNEGLQHTGGSQVTLTATAAPFFAFWSWTGDAAGTAATAAVSVNRDRAVGARFVARGDCNGDRLVDAGDVSATILRIFGSFGGTPGCDANADAAVDAGDISCVILKIFNGPAACGS